MKKTAIIFAALLALSQNAVAKDWQIDYAHSTLGFTGDQGGTKFTGEFKKFTAQISFDPDHPETGHITVDVNTGTAVTGSSDRDDMLPEKDWFDITTFPQAQFVTTAIRAAGKDKAGRPAYVADATLTIKGMVKNVALPFTLFPEDDHWRAQGSVVLTRSDFGIGQGVFASESYVKNPVAVTFDLTAKPTTSDVTVR